jgi:hypothetical protein
MILSTKYHYRSRNLPCKELAEECWAREVRGGSDTGSETSDFANAREIEAWDPWDPWELSFLNLDGVGSREGKGRESDDHGGLHVDDVWGI